MCVQRTHTPTAASSCPHQHPHARQTDLEMSLDRFMAVSLTARRLERVTGENNAHHPAGIGWGYARHIRFARTTVHDTTLQYTSLQQIFVVVVSFLIVTTAGTASLLGNLQCNFATRERHFALQAMCHLHPDISHQNMKVSMPRMKRETEAANKTHTEAEASNHASTTDRPESKVALQRLQRGLSVPCGGGGRGCPIKEMYTHAHFYS